MTEEARDSSSPVHKPVQQAGHDDRSDQPSALCQWHKRRACGLSLSGLSSRAETLELFSSIARVPRHHATRQKRRPAALPRRARPLLQRPRCRHQPPSPRHCGPFVSSSARAGSVGLWSRSSSQTTPGSGTESRRRARRMRRPKASAAATSSLSSTRTTTSQANVSNASAREGQGRLQRMRLLDHAGLVDA
jgi:hypothetical protein